MIEDRMKRDEWGADPSVRSMRCVFAAMETGQEQILKAAGLSPLDGRLGQLRRTALHLFERAWAAAARSGTNPGEQDLADLYLRCLAEVLETRGITVPSDVLRPNPVADRILSEIG
jgi:hypothetical protein